MSITVKGEYNGYEISGHTYSDGSVGWKCEAIKAKDAKYGWELEEFSNPNELTAAIDKYDLNCRKKFTNKTAYLIRRGYGEGTSWEKVEVTSVDPKGKEAWVKEKNGRRKYNITELYESEEAVKSYAQALDATYAAYKRDQENLQAVVDKCRWVPKHE